MSKRTIKELNLIKEELDFDVALRYPTNEPMLRITTKRAKNKQYIETPISRELYDLLKRFFKV